MVVDQVFERIYTVDEAFDYCAKITIAHYENFPVASLFMPEEKRPYIQAIYAFSRTADDIADEFSWSRDERLAKLQEWEYQLARCYEGEASHPTFIALRETVRKQNIPIEPLRDLLTAFKRDVIQNRYETFDDLLSYCACSANPVGKLVLLIFGYREEKLFKLSDNICTALQLANFWQDVSVDREKDRLYIPLEDMNRFEYSLEKWNKGVIDDSFREIMKYEVGRTRTLFYDGALLPSLVERDLQLELKLVWLGGMKVIKKLERIRCDVIRHRPKLSIWNKLSIFLSALFVNDLTRFGKKREPWELTS